MLSSEYMIYCIAALKLVSKRFTYWPGNTTSNTS